MKPDHQPPQPKLTEEQIQTRLRELQVQEEGIFKPKAPAAQEQRIEPAAGKIKLEKLERDPMYAEALRLVSKLGKVSTSSLQLGLRLDYGRAVQILNDMELDKIITPRNEKGFRKVILKSEQIGDLIKTYESAPPEPEPGLPKKEDIVAYCRTCGKSLDEAGARRAFGTVYCADHLPERPLSASNVERSHRDYKLPSTQLLDKIPPHVRYDENMLKRNASVIADKLNESGVEGEIVEIRPGPTVATFEFRPAEGTKYSKITDLAEDLVLALGAESVIMRPVPEKGAVGIEVPNPVRETVGLREILESDNFKDSKDIPLTFALGKNTEGRPFAASIEQMRHLLIAGMSASGKTAMMDSIIVSTLYRSKPEEVRMILVDPKRSAFGKYNGLPHLLEPVIEDPTKAIMMLQAAVAIMESRLRMLAEYGARNVDQYNEKIKKLKPTEGDGKRPEPMPRILIAIDELADLMMTDGRNTEESIVRLVQMGRAVGIHLVVGTGRPSVDVVTGLIKANLPARMCFRVPTGFDSRTVLDTQGAEHLLGKGDMFFLPPDSSRLIRLQGAFVSDEETKRVVDFWRSQVDSNVSEPMPDEGALEREEAGRKEAERAAAIATLREAIEQEKRRMEERKKERETLLKELEEIRRRSAESIIPPAETIETLKANLESLKIEYKKTLILRPKKRGKLRKEISSLETTIKEKEEAERLAKKREEETAEERRAKQEIEKDREQNPFKHFIINEMSAQAFELLFEKKKEEVSLEDINDMCGNEISGKDGKKVSVFTPNFIMPSRSNTVYFSSNGFSLQLLNEKECRDKDGRLTSVMYSKGKYKLVSPDWTYRKGEDVLTYEQGKTLLVERALEYQKQKLTEFEGKK